MDTQQSYFGEREMRAAIRDHLKPFIEKEARRRGRLILMENRRMQPKVEAVIPYTEMAPATQENWSLMDIWNAYTDLFSRVAAASGRFLGQGYA